MYKYIAKCNYRYILYFQIEPPMRVFVLNTNITKNWRRQYKKTNLPASILVHWNEWHPRVCKNSKAAKSSFARGLWPLSRGKVWVVNWREPLWKLHGRSDEGISFHCRWLRGWKLRESGLSERAQKGKHIVVYGTGNAQREREDAEKYYIGQSLDRRTAGALRLCASRTKPTGKSDDDAKKINTCSWKMFLKWQNKKHSQSESSIAVCSALSVIYLYGIANWKNNC